MGSGGRYGCSCGSPLWSEWVYDAQGIELFRACDACVGPKLAGVRAEILTGYDQSDVSELIEADY